MAKLWKPKKYQELVSDNMVENYCYGLLLDPGLGKTSATLDALLKIGAKATGKVLVVAPLRVIQCVWDQEIAKWENFKSLRWQQISGSSPAKRNANCEVDADIYGINPESLVWLLEEKKDFLKGFDTIIFDESTKFKNQASKRFKTVRKHLDEFTNRYILTGTPMPNGIMDLWAQVYLLDKGERLGRTISSFRQKYFTAINRGAFNEYILNVGSEEKIYEAISDIVVRLSEKDYLDLPPMIYTSVDVELPVPIMKSYRELERDFFAFMDGEDFVAVNAAVASGKCRQFASGGLYKNQDILAGEFGKPKEVVHIHDEKTKAVQDLVESLGGSPVLIAYEFKHDLERLQKAFPNAPVFGSGLTQKRADQLVRDWNNGEIPIMLCQPSSMGHGLNMQESGNNIIWYTITWNLELFDQFNKRLHRPGQAKPVYIHLVKALGTIDEGVAETLTMKSNNQSTFLDALHSYRRKRDGRK